MIEGSEDDRRKAEKGTQEILLVDGVTQDVAVPGLARVHRQPGPDDRVQEPDLSDRSVPLPSRNECLGLADVKKHLPGLGNPSSDRFGIRQLRDPLEHLHPPGGGIGEGE